MQSNNGLPKIGASERSGYSEVAKGTARPDSDVDLAIKLMPATKGTDWALWRYSQFGDEWQNELIAILGRHVSLELLPPSDRDIGPRVLLWTRSGEAPK
jgi:predicted nucleotidyltransferase